MFGGYSWGVKGKQLAEFGVDGIKDITEGLLDSREKFQTLVADNSFINNSDVYTVGGLFKDKLTGNIANASVMVSITSVDEEMVAGTYTPDTSDWTKGTITFKEGYEGLVKITIQDYQNCTPTTLYVYVTEKILQQILDFNTKTGNTNIGKINFAEFLNQKVNFQ